MEAGTDLKQLFAQLEDHAQKRHEHVEHLTIKVQEKHAPAEQHLFKAVESINSLRRIAKLPPVDASDLSRKF